MRIFLIRLLNSVFWGLGWLYGLPRRIRARRKKIEGPVVIVVTPRDGRNQ